MISSAENRVIDTDQALHNAIESGVAALGASLNDDQIARLTRYLLLLKKWNRVYRLSGVRDAYQMIATHLLDSLSVVDFIHGPRVLDIGSGAGLPGIPLAIAKPDMPFVLLDANAKKLRFIRQAVIELGLRNVSVECQRIETYRSEAGFDTVISRAFASLMEFAARAAPVCASAGRMLAMKSSLSAAEQLWLRSMPETLTIYKLNVPLIKSERQLIEIRIA